jgi:galactose mutarotase-like enzyme
MRYKISNDFLMFEADSRGAEPMSIKTLQEPVEFLWQGDPQYWTGRSPTLFPIVGALKNNRYRVQGKEYEMNQHGFARNSSFELVESTHHSLTWVLRENLQTLNLFPFPFELFTTYHLEGNSISIGHQVVNTGQKIMWFSIGEHPGFNCPFFKGESMEDYSLVFNQEEVIDRRFLENSLLAEKKELFLDHEKTIQLSKGLFKRKAIILENFKSSSVSLISKNHPRKVTVTFDGYPFLGIWSPPAGAPFVCIEPWHGVASPEDSDGDITRKPGILSLEAGQKFHCGYKIMID